MVFDVKVAVNQLLKNLNASLRPFGFKRSGQSFSRETQNCWQVINIQLSRWSTGESKRLTVNIGVTSKTLLRFRSESVDKAPLYYCCPMNLRIGQLFEIGDHWWEIEKVGDDSHAFTEIFEMLQSRGLPLLDLLQTDIGILEFYASGKVMGFEIDRDETRLILTAHQGPKEKIVQYLGLYEARWVPSKAATRATNFLETFRLEFADELHATS